MAAYTVTKTRYMPPFNCASDKKVDDLRIHAILDGRDTPPKSAERNLSKLEKLLEAGIGQISTVSGRFSLWIAISAGIV